MVAMFVTRPRPKKDAMTAPPRKKRKADHALDEINFDDTARADYLTGFHKRKVQRQKQAQEIAAEKARVERIQIRKEVREQRSKDVQEHVKQVNDALRAARLAGGEEVTDEEDDEDEWKGLEDDTPKKEAKPDFVDHEEEYIDEDKYTTVTIEAVDIDREGMHALSGRHTSDSEESDDESGGEGGGEGGKKKKGKNGKAPETDDKDAKKSKDKKEWPKKKKKKFRYENKLERQINKLNKKAKQSKRQ